MIVDLSFFNRGNKVGENHFGANYLANRQAANQSIEDQNLFGLASAAIGASGFRYPGGTITEKFFDIADPRHLDFTNDEIIQVSNYFDSSEISSLTRLSSFLKFADSIDQTVTVVIPTIRYFNELNSDDAAKIIGVEEEIKSFIHEVMTSAYGHVVAAFEIGNEFPSWVAGHNVPILRDSIDFAMITRNFSVWIDEALVATDVVDPPSILAQAAFVVYGSRGNKVLIEGFFDEDLSSQFLHVEEVQQAYLAIDGITVHSYPLTPWSTDGLGLDSLDRDVTLFERWQTTFNEYATLKEIDQRKLSFAVTEWNTRNLAMNNGLVEGIQAATGTVASFYYLVRNGVDLMHVWPVLQGSTSALVDSQNMELSANFNGAAFSVLNANLIGLRAHQGKTHFDIDGDGQNDILVQLYTSQEKAVLIVASISDEFLDFSLGLPVEQFDFGASLWTSFSLSSTASDLTNVLGRPTLLSDVDHVSVSEDSLTATYSIDPWEINFLTFAANLDAGATMLHQPRLGAESPLSFSAGFLLDDPDGSVLQGLKGGFFHLQASDSSDVVSSIPGFLLDSGGGDDQVFDTPFSDTIVAGDGDDLVILNSSLVGDFVHGGNGNDQIWFGSAPNLLLGGPDNDVFHFKANAKHEANTFAVNATSVNQFGTLEWISVADMNMMRSIIVGGDGYDILMLSDSDDALFLDDQVTDHFSTKGLPYQSTQRIVSIEEIHAGPGNDLIDLTSSRASSRQESLRIYGGEDNDVIWSNEGNDHIFGGEGDDTIFSGAGIDHLYGGPRADTFVFTRTSLGSTIHDFSPDEGDLLRFVDSGGAVFNRMTLAIDENHISIDGYDENGSIFSLSVILAHNELSYD